MVLRLTLFINLLILGIPGEATLKAEAPTQACKSTVTGTLEMVPFESKVYGDKRLMRVWLPTGYSSSKTSVKRYPVLYLFDAQDLFDRCTSRPGQDEWHVDETLTDLIDRKAVQPLIVVGIDNSGPGHREDEYSRYSAIADAPQKLSAFMTIEVLPLIDLRYRTISDRTHRGVGGASLGSLAALTLLRSAWACLRALHCKMGTAECCKRPLRWCRVHCAFPSEWARRKYRRRKLLPMGFLTSTMPLSL